MNHVRQDRAPTPGADFSTAIVGYGAVAGAFIRSFRVRMPMTSPWESVHAMR